MTFSTNRPQRKISLWTTIASVAVLSLMFGCDKGPALNEFTDFTFEGQQASKSLTGTVGSSVRKIEIGNQFGDVKIVTSDGPASMSWSCSCWAATKQEAESFLQKVELKEFTSGITQTWTLQVPRGPWVVDGIESSVTLTLPATTNLEVKNRFGNVSIDGSEADIKLINMYGDIVAENLVGKCDFENGFGAVTVENVAQCRISNSQGNTTVKNVTGMLEAKNSFGQLEVTGVQGPATIENSKGNIIAKNIDGKATLITGYATLNVDGVTGDANITNSHGRIYADNLTGSTVRIGNSFGPVEFSTAATSIECTNQNGKIEAEFTNPEFLNAKLTTKFNDVSLHLPATLTPEFKIDAKGGKVTSEFVGQASSNEQIVEVTTENGNVFVKKTKTE